MATKIDQKAYLQKYLSGRSGDKKKKKKKVSKGTGFKIIDDDLDLSKLRPLEGDELDILGEGEDAPQIAGIIDERPEEVKKLEQFKTTSKWRVINEDDGFNSKLQIEEIKKDVKEAEKENELIFGKMYSDSEDEQKQNSDLSPPRKQQANQKQPAHDTTKKPLNHSDSDFSPPRKKSNEKHTSKKSHSKNTDSDTSPPRKREESKSKQRQDSDSDLSPPRKKDRHDRKESRYRETHKYEKSDVSPPRKSAKSNDRSRKPSRWGDFKEEEERYKRAEKSPPLYQRSSRSPDLQNIKNKRNKSTNSHTSAPRKTQRNNEASDSDLSPPRKTKKNYDSDLSPPRKTKKHYDSDLSPPRKRKHSPERQKDYNNTHDNKYSSNRSGKYADNRHSDNQSRNFREESKRYSKERDYSSKKNNRFDQSPSRSNQTRGNDKRRYNRQNSDSPPPTNKKMEKTLEGKKAGLQDALELRQENDAFRRREEEAFSKMTDEVSGRNAQVVSRKGKRETSEERRKLQEKADRQKELDEKYKKWGKGLKQIEDQEKRVQEFMHEASKPLARHKGDRDLEDRLKDVEREGDPMLQYIRGKKRDRGELGPEKPSYKGSFPPNRFNIRPGYRWDGVDRSNGYEKKFFDQQSKRKAQAEEAYKWSTEDL